jgi:Ca-activated chloride channel family protein
VHPVVRCDDEGAGAVKFLAPQWLWLFAAVGALLLLYVLLQWRRKRYAVRFSNTALLGSLAPKRPGWRRHVAFTLLLLSLASLTVAMSRPSRQVKVPRDRATVMLVIDVSFSMDASDVQPTRLKAAQAAAKEFAGMLPSSINLGLESFSGTTSIDAKPTTNRTPVKQAIDRLHTAASTATGDAIFAALDALHSFQQEIPSNSDKAPPERIVMLSDGARTLGRSVDSAIQAAKQAKVPISTIAFGTPNGEVDIEGNRSSVPVDTDTMKQIASGTGGSYHAAASEGELHDIYKNLGSQIGYVKRPHEVTTWAIGIGLILAFTAVGASLFWTNRLL